MTYHKPNMFIMAKLLLDGAIMMLFMHNYILLCYIITCLKDQPQN